MTLFPAIDLKDGKAVRLSKGLMESAKIYNESPVEQVRIFESMGAEWVHLVDLNGAFAGEPVNHEVIRKIRANCSVKLELGGGIRDEETIKRYLDLGIDRVILGNGSDELIQMIIQSVAIPGRVIMAPEPTFVMYRQIASVAGLEFAGVALRAVPVRRRLDEHLPARVVVDHLVVARGAHQGARHGRPFFQVDEELTARKDPPHPPCREKWFVRTGGDGTWISSSPWYTITSIREI